jgi:tRNA(Ile)-lysidine synthase
MQLLANINWPQPGKYVVAVSGGLDSVTLLNVFSTRRKDYELVVVYIDHGWRDSSKEHALVQQVAGWHDCDFKVSKLELKGTSEDEARRARYAALEEARAEVGAKATITAHHLDDRMETVFLNVLRGTGRQGLSALQSQGDIVRPLLNVRRAEIEQYARQHKLEWVEDPTNTDVHYRRNWVRRVLLPALGEEQPVFDDWMIERMGKADHLNRAIDQELNEFLMKISKRRDGGVEFRQAALSPIPTPLLQELLVLSVRKLAPEAQLDYRAIEQLAVQLKLNQFLGSNQLTKRLFVDCSRGTVTIAFKAQ